MQAMILAAGFGTRLLPYTEFRPKPLFPLLNVPLLNLTIKRLQNNGFTKIVINCHHLKEQIIESVKDIPGVIIQEESEILGTGGGLRMALPHFDNAPLLVTNGDIYHTIDFGQLYRHHIFNGNSLTLAVHDFPRFNSILTDAEGKIHFEKKQGSSWVAFTGVHVVNPAILEPIKDGIQSCIISRYRKVVQDKGEICSLRTDDCFWTDMGTVADYLKLHAALLTGTAPLWPEFMQEKVGNHYFSSQDIHVGNTLFEDWSCLGKVSLGKNVKIARSVIWDKTVVPDNTIIHDKLLTPFSDGRQ